MTILQDRHLPRFQALTAEQCLRVLVRVDSWLPASGTPVDGSLVFSHCRGLGFDQARVVLALARESDDVGRGAVECLVGRPISPWIPEEMSCLRPGPLPQIIDGKIVFATPHEASAPRPPSRQQDMRVVISKAANPKKKNTDAWDGYEAWVVGETVEAARARGLSTKAITVDVERGWVVLGEPA
jgi:hypothetical protein